MTLKLDGVFPIKRIFLVLAPLTENNKIMQKLQNWGLFVSTLFFLFVFLFLQI